MRYSWPVAGMVILPKYLINLECGLEKCYYVQNKMKKGGGMMTVILGVKD